MKRVLFVAVCVVILGGIASAASPTLVAKYSAVNQTASIAQTTIYTVPSNGTAMYRFSVYIEIQGDCTSGNSIAASFNWTDDLTSQLGAGGFSVNCNGADRFGSGGGPVRLAGGTTFSVQTAQTIGTYSIFVVVEKLE